MDLQMFREYYRGLDAQARARFREWVLPLGRPLPSDLEGFVRLMGEMGWAGDRPVGDPATAGLMEESKEAERQLQSLRQAIEAWERGEEYVPPLEGDGMAGRPTGRHSDPTGAG